MTRYERSRTLFALAVVSGLPLAISLLAGLPHFTLLPLLLVWLGACLVFRTQVS